jgi:hypothetical protein
MPSTATTKVASVAARNEIESGFHTHGGIPRSLSHDLGIRAITATRRSMREGDSRAPSVARSRASRSHARR